MNFFTSKFFIITQKYNINYLRAILESYDNGSIVTAVDAKLGFVLISTSTSLEEFIKQVIRTLNIEICVDFLNL